MNRKQLLMLLLLSLSFGAMMAQDVIVKKDGSTILVKVEEISTSEIKYKKWSNLEGPTYSVNKSEISRINYQNGDVEIISNAPSETPNQPNYGGGKLDIGKKNQLTLDGRTLSESEARQLLGNETYERYLAGLGMYRTGLPFAYIGILGTVVGGICLGVGLSTKDPSLTTTGWITSGVGLPCFIVGIAVGRTGANRMLNVISEYNSKQPVSFNVSPSIMSTKDFGQNDFGPGLTFSVNF